MFGWSVIQISVQLCAQEAHWWWEHFLTARTSRLDFHTQNWLEAVS